MSAEPPPDPLRSPYEALYGWAMTRRLHPMTWLVILAGLLHLVGDIAITVAQAGRFLGASGGGISEAEIVAQFVERIGYSLWLFGTAAIVEFLFRIWVELRLRNRTDSRG